MSDAPPATAAEPLPRVLSPSLFKLALGLHFFMLYMSLYNLLPYYLELRGASPDVYGQVAGSMGVANVAALALLGHRADRWSRKATLASYFSLTFAGNAVTLWAMGRESLEWFYLARLLQGAFMGVGFPILFSWLVELSPPQRKHVVLAWLGIFGILANSLGPTLGELVLSLQPDPDAPAAYYPVFWMATAFLVCAFAVWMTAPNTHPSREEGGSRGLAPMLRRKESVLLLAIALSFGGLFGVVMSFGKNYTAELGLAFVAVLLWAYSLGAIASRVLIQALARWVSQRVLILAALCGMALAFGCLSLARGYPLLGTAGLVYGLSHGVLYPTLFVKYLDWQHPSEMGRSTTLYQGSFSIGWGLFPLVGGTLVRLTSFPTYFAGLAVVAGACTALLLLADRLAPGRAGGAEPGA